MKEIRVDFNRLVYNEQWTVVDKGKVEIGETCMLTDRESLRCPGVATKIEPAKYSPIHDVVYFTIDRDLFEDY